MLKNLQVKEFLSRLMEGSYVSEDTLMPPYPTMDVTKATVVSKTSDYTVTVDDLDAPTIFNNGNATANVSLTLPAVANAKGKIVRAYSTAAYTIRFVPQSGEKINCNGSAVASKYAQLFDDAAGNMMEAFCDGTQWIITQSNAQVTKEA